jgi:Circularly permutated YpsA SLOG family
MFERNTEPLIVLHSGQTGVERGVHRAAEATGLRVAGFSTRGRRDELGRLPDNISSVLTPCHQDGPRAALRATLSIASGLVILVPDATRFKSYAGVSELVRAGREKPIEIIDPRADESYLTRFVDTLPYSNDPVRLMITGPRGTRWPEGERVAWQLVAGLAIFADLLAD